MIDNLPAAPKLRVPRAIQRLRLRGMVAEVQRAAGAQISLADWLSMFTYQGNVYGVGGTQTLIAGEDRVESGFSGYVQGAYKQNGIVFACMTARALLFSEASFRFRRVVNGRPGELFGTQELGLLETPWPGGSTSDLLMRAIQDVDLCGNHFSVLKNGYLHRLRPDWVTVVAGSPTTEGGAWSSDVELLGYAFHPGGVHSGNAPEVYMPDQMLHWAPIPDPGFQFRGMSWLTPVLAEINADGAATRHKLKFFENGATPNMVVSLDQAVSPENFEKWIKIFEGGHVGVENAYKTLYLGGGAQTTVVGADMKQIDFKVTQGHGETRVCAAARVPPIIVGLSEGLEAATYSNYGQARRAFSDGTIRPLWRSFAHAASQVIAVPANAQLWYDDRGVPFLQEDLKDAAVIQNQEALTITALIREGYDPSSVVAAVENNNWGLLKHTGLVSVQLHTPGDTPAVPGAPAPPPAPPGTPAQ